jgi:hypothetical protein
MLVKLNISEFNFWFLRGEGGYSIKIHGIYKPIPKKDPDIVGI